MGALAVVKNLVRPSVALIEAELDEVKSRAAAAAVDVDKLHAQRLDASSWEEATVIAREIERQEWVIGQAELQISKLMPKLAAAKADERAALLAKLRKPFPPALRDFFEKALAAQQAFQSLMEIKLVLESNGFGHESAALVLPPHINGAPLLNAELLERARLEFESGGVPKIAKVAAPAAAVSKATPAAAPPPTTRAPRMRRAPRKDVADAGQALVSIIRPGVDVDGFSSITGDEIAMAPERADALVRAGAAEFASAESRTAP